MYRWLQGKLSVPEIICECFENGMDYLYENMLAFNVNLIPTRGMGKITELFRTLPRAYRSNI